MTEIVGEEIPIPISIICAPVATVKDCPTRWPFLDKYNFENAVVTNDDIRDFLTPKWKLAIAFVRTNCESLPQRIPEEFDLKRDRTATCHWHHPVQLDRGTISYVDTKASLDHARAVAGADRIIMIGDMQKFLRDWMYLAKYDEEDEAREPGSGHALTTCFPGEFHARFHTHDADDLLNKTFLYYPIFVCFDVKPLAKDRMKMKDQRRREVWGLVIFSAALKYFLTIWTPEELADIQKLLKLVKHNLPVSHLLGWAYYHGNHNWACRFAVRTSDIDYLDWMWRYGLLMYAPTNKNQYKKGCMCAMKVLYDSEPNVRSILSEFRTYRESSAPCVAEELDMMEEKVLVPPAFVCSLLILL